MTLIRLFFFSSRRRHTRCGRDWSSDVCSSDLHYKAWKRLAAELGFFFSEEHNERLKGVSRMRSLEILLEVGGIEKSPEEKEKLAARKNQRSEEHTSELQSRPHLVCRLLLEKKK